MKILVIEDDVKIAAAIRRGLEAEGFTIEHCDNGIDGLWRATEFTYDLIALDLMLPGRNGYQICADLRRAGHWTPILMLFTLIKRWPTEPTNSLRSSRRRSRRLSSRDLATRTRWARWSDPMARFSPSAATPSDYRCSARRPRARATGSVPRTYPSTPSVTGYSADGSTPRAASSRSTSPPALTTSTRPSGCCCGHSQWVFPWSACSWLSSSGGWPDGRCARSKPCA